MRISAERANARAASQALWKGLLRFNRRHAGPLRYKRTVLCARDAKGKLLGGLIMQTYWRETYVELLWLSERARAGGTGARLVAEAERRARKLGSHHIHLNTYSFQAPRFYEKQGYRRFGALSGSPGGHQRYFYMKRLRGAGSGAGR
ncbi:MAG TPA: GNAT family N-acetyltransferase [Burkholderiales bacterium]|nr:GNAT family N-acetyltransferase [Burkholderiales bacterium]